MKAISILSICYFLLATVACKRCEHSINFACLAANKGDTAFIYLDDRLVFKEVYKASYFKTLEFIKPQVRNYCSSADSIKVRAGFNDHDTVFYVDPKDVKYCYISNSMRDSLIVYIHSISKPLVVSR
ncbi:hypothetical protein [Chitinophaga sp. S165]|uniref:hypothetical protein n=1 Tax=Chitinophaga sp. S165 TaxID=2135462 RepID=UPI000D71207A|nr:hypothetical protein [Chitinophaga sp. S165]PWV47155.1 hypothetical protein C7475_109243 [Chitinophaga sp. S165]